MDSDEQLDNTARRRCVPLSAMPRCITVAPTNTRCI